MGASRFSFDAISNAFFFLVFCVVMVNGNKHKALVQKKGRYKLSRYIYFSAPKGVGLNIYRSVAEEPENYFFWTKADNDTLVMNGRSSPIAPKHQHGHCGLTTAYAFAPNLPALPSTREEQ